MRSLFSTHLLLTPRQIAKLSRVSNSMAPIGVWKSPLKQPAPTPAFNLSVSGPNPPPPALLHGDLPGSRWCV
ncbi:hypothetical protein J5X98_06430 [Leptothermofonsia sichuanensis E412]|uniref:hypothetical protein n=1 Tax=Leptothermofonsia sichuanensis TaxID=2917832 RepID=UPI001CA6CC99|nr:hypothetical protein [Leptothermofonsia sichuanensis]QZZ22042.1 hypothetical protein J5X98_06430 [Leptothermofonsia sichuanensis E412]